MLRYVANLRSLGKVPAVKNAMAVFTVNTGPAEPFFRQAEKSGTYAVMNGYLRTQKGDLK